MSVFVGSPGLVELTQPSNLPSALTSTACRNARYLLLNSVRLQLSSAHHAVAERTDAWLPVGSLLHLNLASLMTKPGYDWSADLPTPDLNGTINCCVLCHHWLYAHIMQVL